MRLKELSAFQQFVLLGTIIFAALIILLLLAEATVRVRHFFKYGNLWGIESTYMVDPKSGLRTPIPGSTFGSIRINSLGFRSPEIKDPKPPATVRLAFLGGSTTYCAEVSSNEVTWPHLVWQKVSHRWPKIDFDYVNAGVPGYGASSSLRNLVKRIKGLQPDVIFIYHATNDLSANSFGAAVKHGIVEKRTEQTLSWPSNYSLLWYLIEKNTRVTLSQKRAYDTINKLSPNWNELKQSFKSDLSALVRESKAIADVVVLITFSHHIRHDQPPEQKKDAAITALYYMPYMSVDNILKGYNAYNNLIRSVAVDTGTLLIDNAMKIPGDNKNFKDSVHFTDQGSRAMAKHVFEALEESDSVKSFLLTHKRAAEVASK